MYEDLPGTSRFKPGNEVFGIGEGTSSSTRPTLRTDPFLKLAYGSLPETGEELASQPIICRMENALVRAPRRADPGALEPDL
jgi:hypothetical protein